MISVFLYSLYLEELIHLDISVQLVVVDHVHVCCGFCAVRYDRNFVLV